MNARRELLSALCVALPLVVSIVDTSVLFRISQYRMCKSSCICTSVSSTVISQTAFGEDAPGTAGLITVELTDVQMQENLHILNRQIPDGAFIAAVDTMSRSTTYRTAGARRDPFTGEDQALGLSA